MERLEHYVCRQLRGRLASFSGTATSSGINISSNNFVDARGYPIETGVWTLIVDDATSNGIGTGTPIQFGLTASAGNYNISPSGLQPATIAGTLSGGKLVGQTWQWTLTRSGTASWNPGLELQVGIPGQSGVYNYTASNEALFTPLTTAAAGGSPSRSNLLGPSQETLNLVRTPTGRNPNRIRAIEVTSGFGAASAIVDADDLNRVTDLSWDYSGSRTISITTIRTWALGGESWPAIFSPAPTWSSPDVYLQHWNNPTGYAINSIRVVNGGSSYSSSPVVTVSGGGGSGFTVGAVTVSGGVITAIARVVQREWLHHAADSHDQGLDRIRCDRVSRGGGRPPEPGPWLGWFGGLVLRRMRLLGSAWAQDRSVHSLEQLLRFVQGLERHQRDGDTDGADRHRMDDRGGDGRYNLCLLFLGWAGQHLRFR